MSEVTGPPPLETRMIGRYLAHSQENVERRGLRETLLLVKLPASLLTHSRHRAAANHVDLLSATHPFWVVAKTLGFQNKKHDNIVIIILLYVYY